MFIRAKDFERLIRPEELAIILEDNLSLLAEVEELAKKKIESYLAHRYDLTTVFTDLQPFNLSEYYPTQTPVVYSEPVWNIEKQYVTGERFSYNGFIYEVISDIQGVEPPNEQYYALLYENELIFVTRRPVQGYYPDQPFAYLGAEQYFTDFDDIKGWDRQTPLVLTRKGTRLELTINGKLKGWIDYYEDEELPRRLVVQPFADAYGRGLRGELTQIGRVADGQVITVTTDNYFERKDPRNPVVLDWVLKIALYEIHSRINPRQIPDLRVKQYDDVIAELKRASKGEVNIDLPLQADEEKQNVPFLWGSSPSKAFKF